MSDPVLSIRGVERTYVTGDSRLAVLQGVDLDLYPGEIVGLIGPSGSGKSSLLHAAGLLEHPDAGRIIVEGRRLFSPGHIQTIARFRPGETFRADRLEDLRRALVATGLVSSVDVRAVKAGDPGTVDVAVTLEPAPMRTWGPITA